MLDNLERIIDFKQGENRQQAACLYKNEGSIGWEQLNGGELTYKNFLNMSVLVDVLSEFYDVFATVMAKVGLPSVFQKLLMTELQKKLSKANLKLF